MIHAIQMKRPDGQSYFVSIQVSYTPQNIKQNISVKKEYDPCCACIV